MKYENFYISPCFNWFVICVLNSYLKNHHAVRKIIRTLRMLQNYTMNVCLLDQMKNIKDGATPGSISMTLPLWASGVTVILVVEGTGKIMINII